MSEKSAMKKILYLMEIDWYWIKQRPQIIAEMLSADYDVTVVYHKEIFVKQSLREEKDELEKSIPIPAIPYRDKNKVAYMVQKFFYHKIMKNIDQYDIVWITHPLLYRYIPKTYQGKIVYDCMDNHEALCSDRVLRGVIRKTEEHLATKADIVLTSSNGLRQKMERFTQKEKVFLIRNGFVLQEIHPPQTSSLHEDRPFKIGYFGTIAEWFDFPLLLKSLDKFPNLEYHLWGPISKTEQPKHPRILFEGVIEHSQLWEKVKDVDCLIMPFVVNDIVKDVDPVKLYEYISMGKCILTVFYNEIRRFDGLVYYYHDAQEYIKCMQQLIENGFKCQYSMKQQESFLSLNSWEKRKQDMYCILEK